jgi:2-polyprenyl-3-methyl-5-hydroxy-6-metoxy-1,4-benzoquinol methylase/Flp pilus assembly protein TadD
MSSSEAFSVEQLLDEASVNRDEGRLEDAVRIYRSILQEHPQNTEAQKALHKLQKLMNKTSGKGSARSGRKAKTKRKARLAKAGSVARTKSARTKSRPQAADRDVQRMLALFNGGQFLEAELGTRHLIQRFPHDAMLYNMLGAALGEQGKTEQAVASYVQAINLKQDYGEAHTNLAMMLNKLGLQEQAAESCRLAIAAEPDNIRAHNCLGHILRRQGRFDEAVTCHARAHKIDPESWEPLAGFAEAVQHVQIIKTNSQAMELIGLCFEHAEVTSENVVAASQAILTSVLEKHISAGALTHPDLADITPHAIELLSAHLKNAMMANIDLERILNHLRRTLLESWSIDDQDDLTANKGAELLEAFAYHAYINEYIWHVSDDENERLEALEAHIASEIQVGAAPNEFELYLLASYRPLWVIECIRNWALKERGNTSDRLKDFLRTVIYNSERERELGEQLECLTSIDNEVSVAVRSQYEENPYPRWHSISVGDSLPYTELIQKDIAPHKCELKPTSPSPEILIAGCGTGKQPILTAIAVQNSNVLAVDLSRTSLSYAKRKAEEFNVRNIRFAQADILKLGELDRSFDVIECSGVLHHMADPEAGLRVLLERLKPGGMMNIALYSEIAREQMGAWGELVSENNFDSSLQGMRDFRAWINANDTPEARALHSTSDFYTASMLRDLMFHVQEHRYTLPKIEALLDRNNLEFLGFRFIDPNTKPDYVKRFPKDPDGTDLKKWHNLELHKPNLFLGMYQFWCRKGAEDS